MDRIVNTSFKVESIEPLATRKMKIDAALENPLREEPFHTPPDYPGGAKVLSLKVIRIHHKYLIHNADNERVRNEIDKIYDIKLGDDEDYDKKFYNKKEDPITQDILHQLCLRWANIKGDQNVFEEIKNSDVQTKTILINKEGTVIDGNRRLASFRELLKTSDSHQQFEQLECVVLEEVNRQVNKAIEYDKHVKIDTTLNYGYYEKLRIVERLKKQGKSDSKICSILNIKAQELNALIEQNQEVKRVLDFRKKWCFDAGPESDGSEFVDNDITRLIDNQIEYDIRAVSTVQKKNLDVAEKKLRTTLMRTLSWVNAEGASIGGSTFKLLQKDDNLSTAIKDVTNKKNANEAVKELEKILNETKKEKDMEIVNQFALKIVEVAKEAEFKKKEVSKKHDSKDKTLKANQLLNQVKITNETYSKNDKSVIESQLQNAQKNIERILKEIKDFK